MVDSFYDQTFEDWTGDNMNYKWSPAEVNQILFRNFKEPTKAIEELVTLEPRDLYGFDTVAPPATYSDFSNSLEIAQSNFPHTG
jgi:hypothetical protein